MIHQRYQCSFETLYATHFDEGIVSSLEVGANARAGFRL